MFLSLPRSSSELVSRYLAADLCQYFSCSRRAHLSSYPGASLRISVLFLWSVHQLYVSFRLVCICEFLCFPSVYRFVCFLVNVLSVHTKLVFEWSFSCQCAKFCCLFAGLVSIAAACDTRIQTKLGFVLVLILFFVFFLRCDLWLFCLDLFHYFFQ
jgi:hypothetical protein